MFRNLNKEEFLCITNVLNHFVFNCETFENGFALKRIKRLND